MVEKMEPMMQAEESTGKQQEDLQRADSHEERG